MLVPIHQLKETLSTYMEKIPAIATGLKICFLPIANKYLDAWASPAMKARLIKLLYESEILAGVNKKIKIKAVM